MPSKSFVFPPPGLTLKWFAVAWERQDIWRAFGLSVRVACVSTLIALTLGTLAAAALYRTRFFGRETVTLLILLPIALLGIAIVVAGFVLRYNPVLVVVAAGPCRGAPGEDQRRGGGDGEQHGEHRGGVVAEFAQ